MSNRNFLRLIIVISLIAAVALNLFSIFFLSPSFTSLIYEDAELEAIKIGRHLSEPFQSIDRISGELPLEFTKKVDRSISDFGIMKIKVFAPDGKTVYSSSEKDIGKVNERDYFHNNVARGEVFTKVVSSNNKTLEGQVLTADVVETYVPVMNDRGIFAGAFEIYLDITDKKQELDKLLFHSNSLLLIIAAAFILSIHIVSLKAGKSFQQQEKAEEKINLQQLVLQERNNQLSVLNDISRVLSKSIDLKTLLPLVLETVIKRLPVLQLTTKGGIMLVEGEQLILASHLGHDEKFLKQHEKISIHDCLCGLAARTGEIIISKNSQTDSRHSVCWENMDPHGHIIIPLKSAEKVVGVLYLYLPPDFEEEKIRINLLESMAAQVGMAIDNARLYNETMKLALHDSLTGLANRRFMDIKLQQAISLAERYEKPLCVALLDIDFFKKYNDTKGHDAGDKILIKVADKITLGIRKSDLAARFGGEEFLIILPESDLRGAGHAVERIRQDIEQSLDITISGGIALFKKEMSGEDLIKGADTALYTAKQNGRNRIETA